MVNSLDMLDPTRTPPPRTQPSFLPDPFQLFVAGSRTFKDILYVDELVTILRRALGNLHLNMDFTFHHGNALGADQAIRARMFAYCSSLHENIYRPNYQQYGNSAPIIRNRKMLENTNVAAVWWDGKSKGTAFNLQYIAQKWSVGKYYIWTDDSTRQTTYFVLTAKGAPEIIGVYQYLTDQWKHILEHPDRPRHSVRVLQTDRAFTLETMQRWVRTN